MAHCKIASVIYDEKGPRPVALSFQNGSLLPGKQSELSCRLYENGVGNIVPVVTTDNMIYSGKINRRDDLHTTMLAIRNKTTNEVRLIAIDNTVLRPQLQNNREILDTTQMETKVNNTSDLKKQFGSKRTKRQIEQMEKLKINVEAVREQLEKTVADVNIVESDLNPPETSNVSIYMPPINVGASTQSEVYELNSLVPEFVLNSLKQEAERILGESEEAIETNAYVKKELLKLQKRGGSDKLKTATILLYIDCLMNILIATAKVIAKRYEPCPYSTVASKHILDNFTVHTARTRTRPNSMKDKSVCYIIALILNINKFSVDLDGISGSVKLGLKKLQEISRFLRLIVDTKMNVATLKIPLPPISGLHRSPKKGRK